MSITKVVVTGFEPWSQASENPTLVILDRLQQEVFEAIDLRTLSMPVDTERLPERVSEGLDQHRPDVWISLGLNIGLSVIAVERIGANVRDFPVADNAGKQLHDEPVYAGAPLVYPATLPIKAIVAALLERGIPAKVSNSASTYLCNQMMYTTLHLIEQKGMETRGGFIHVPCSPAYVAEQPYPDHELPSMSIELMTEAVKTAILTTAYCKEDVKAPPRGY